MSMTISDGLRHLRVGFHSYRLARHVLGTGPWMSVHRGFLRRKSKKLRQRRDCSRQLLLSRFSCALGFTA